MTFTEKRLLPLRAEHQKQQTVELAGWRVRLLSYPTAGRYEAQVETVGSGAIVGHASELTREAAENTALEHALARLQASKRNSFDSMVGG